MAPIWPYVICQRCTGVITCRQTSRTVTAEDGRMLQRVLKARYGMSRRLLRKLKANACVRVNGEAAYLTSRVTAGDRVRVILPEDRGRKLCRRPCPFTSYTKNDDLLVSTTTAGCRRACDETLPGRHNCQRLGVLLANKGRKAFRTTGQPSGQRHVRRHGLCQTRVRPQFWQNSCRRERACVNTVRLYTEKWNVTAAR